MVPASAPGTGGGSCGRRVGVEAFTGSHRGEQAEEGFLTGRPDSEGIRAPHPASDEALFITTSERRERPFGSLRVLLVGGAESETFLLRFVLADLPLVEVVDATCDAASGLTAVSRAAPHLVLADHLSDVRLLRRRLEDACPRGHHRPLLAVLTNRIAHDDEIKDDSPDAWILKPVSHDRCRALVERLFRG